MELQDSPRRRRKISSKFTSVLAFISIVGFLEIILNSFFEINVKNSLKSVTTS